MTDGNLRIIDEFSLSESKRVRITENLITQLKPVVEQGGIVLSDGVVKAMLVIEGADHMRDVWVKKYPHSNHFGKREMVYAIQWDVCPDGQKAKSVCKVKIIE